MRCRSPLVSRLRQLLWCLDELLYPSYRHVQLRSPVFILAPPRTGSTSLHRALLADEPRFFAPLALDFFLPFLCLSRPLRALRARPAVRRRVEAAASALVRLLGIEPGEVARRHPMGLFTEDEDDIALTVHHVTSEISWCAVSHIQAWLWGCHVHRLPAFTRRRSALFLTRIYQKAAFCHPRRGAGRQLCTKSHLVGLLPELKALHPSARFATIVRPAEAVFPSFWGLQRAISRDFGGFETGGRPYLEMRITFLAELNAELTRQFGGRSDTAAVDAAPAGAADAVAELSDRAVLTFEAFTADPVGCTLALYAAWGVQLPPSERAALAQRISTYLAGEEHAHGFPNESWAAIGVAPDELVRRVGCAARALAGRGSYDASAFVPDRFVRIESLLCCHHCAPPPP